jgi:AAA+ superfamily predicted ATPase
VNDTTSKSAQLTWHEANQRLLCAAIATLRAQLVLQTARRTGNKILDAEEQVVKSQANFREMRASLGIRPAFEMVRDAFRLSEFELGVLLLCAGVELDGAFAGACGEASGDVQRAWPSFSLALATIPGGHWSALGPEAPLRRWRLTEFAPSGGLPGSLTTTRPLRIDERVLNYIAGIQHVDERLAAVLDPVHLEKAELTPTHHTITHRLAVLWSNPDAWASLPVIILFGGQSAIAKSVAAHLCMAVQIHLHAIESGSLPTNINDLPAFVRLCEREAILSRSAFYIEWHDDEEERKRERLVKTFIEKTRCPLIVYSRERRALTQRTSMALEMIRPPVNEQAELWRTALREVGETLNGEVDALTAEFSLSPIQMRSAVAAATKNKIEPLFDSLWQSCRQQSRVRLENLAHRIETSASWDDLVLPEAQKETLRDIVSHVRHRSKVYHQWGFGSKSTRGLGLSALFVGTSGTGKTMAAEVLARELRLDLYRIDLSSVVSKYIGETEKNLRQVFDVAEDGGAILLFDEADALFGKRSEVKDSHDRYANIEVGYLLQRMECYRGLAILTTNMKNALDPAFLRRIRFIVQFPFPDAEHRAEIWRHVFPAQTPVKDLDYKKLAQLTIAGGNIRNIALAGAFFAADAGEPVSHTHLLHAARSEYAKLERPLTEVETAGLDQSGR